MQFGSRLFTPDMWRRHATTPIESLIGISADKVISDSESPKLDHQEHDNALLFEQYDQAPNLCHLPVLTNDDNYFSDYQSSCSVTPAIDALNGESYDGNIDLTFGSPGISSVALSALLTPLSSLQQNAICTPGLDFATSPDFFDSTDVCSRWGGEFPTSHPSCSGMENTLQFTSQNTEVQGLGITCKNTPFDLTSASACFSTTAFPFQSHRSLPSTLHTLSRVPSPNTQPRSHYRKSSSRSRANHSQRRRSRPSSQHSSSHQAANTSTGDVGFVNFTPEDSRKILTGVAPSGSSKTKARREREAAERRRKLSQAAMKAVMDAGGDVDSLRHLERDGLLVV